MGNRPFHNKGLHAPPPPLCIHRKREFMEDTSRFWPLLHPSAQPGAQNDAPAESEASENNSERGGCGAEGVKVIGTMILKNQQTDELDISNIVMKKASLSSNTYVELCFNNEKQIAPRSSGNTGFPPPESSLYGLKESAAFVMILSLVVIAWSKFVPGSRGVEMYRIT